MQEESRIGLQTGAGGLPGMRSGNIGEQRETRKCYNCGEVGHLSKVCPRPLKERETVGRGQSGGHGRGRGGQRGGRGGYPANLMVVEDE